jgi:hypothetical protein
MRTRICRSVILLGLFSSVLQRRSNSESSFDERYREARAANPPDLHFVLRTTTPAQFHPGERIPLTLEFSSTAAEKYRLNGATYDRSGRLPTEEFALDRDDVADPLIDYFGSGVIGGIAGGIRGYVALNTEPYRIDVALNDWFRFDRPGKYRLFLKSHRLSRERKPEEQGQGLISFAAVSNVLEIEITEPDPAWDSAKLREIEANLEGADGNHATARLQLSLARLSKPMEDVRVRQARAELKFLGTRGAVQLILRRAQTTDDDLDSFALIGARDRPSVIAELDRYIQNPNTVINSWTLRLRTLFDFVARYPKPLFRNLAELQTGDRTNIQGEAEKRQPEFEKILRERAAALVELPHRKSEKVRDDCLRAIAELAPEAALRAKLIPPDDYGMTREQLIAQFDTLPEANQSELLTRKWGFVRGPGMVSVLLHVIERALPISTPKSGTEFSLWQGPVTLEEQALARLQQLAPEQARQILIEDIARPSPRFAAFAVAKLPSQDVPQANAAFAKSFQADPAATIPLIARFGTVDLYNAVAASYDKEDWICGDQEWFLAYFLRVKPAFGKKLLTDALANPQACGLLLGNLSSILWNRDLEEAAVAALNSPRPWAATDAVRTLGIHGAPAVEGALWHRLEQWNEQWRGRVKELSAHPITGSDPNLQERLFGNALVNAIATGHAWFLDEPRRKRLAALALDDWTRKVWSTEPSGEARVEIADGAPIYGPSYQVSQGSLQYTLSTLEELEAKLAQFPPDTRFRWCPQSFNPAGSVISDERQEMYTDLAHFLDARHMYIDEYSKEACGN